MYQFILLVHVFAALCVIGLVLLQQGKGATMGAAFGSGASQTVFGSRGSGSFLLKLTITFVVIFFSTSIALNYLATQTMKHEQMTQFPAETEVQETSTPSPSHIPMNMPEQAGEKNKK